MVKKIRPIRIEWDVAYIPLSEAHPEGPAAPCAVIDAEDVELVDGVNWSEGVRVVGAGSKRRMAELGWPRLRGYAVRFLPSRRILLLHRYLLGALPNDRVKFRDGDPYNCRRSNIFIADLDAALPDGISRDGAGFRVDDRLPDGSIGLLGVYPTLDAAKCALQTARDHRQRAKKKPDYILGAKLDPAKLAATQERLAKRRAAVGKF